MADTTYNPTRVWPDSASYTSPNADHNVMFPNNTHHRLYLAIRADKPTGDPHQYISVAPYEAWAGVLGSGEKVWAVMPTLGPNAPTQTLRVIHDEAA